MTAHSSSPAADEDGSDETATSVTATSETSWMVTTAVGDLIFGHVTQNDDFFTAYDAQELRIGDYPTLDDAVDIITNSTR